MCGGYRVEDRTSYRTLRSCVRTIIERSIAAMHSSTGRITRSCSVGFGSRCGWWSTNCGREGLKGRRSRKLWAGRLAPEPAEMGGVRERFKVGEKHLSKTCSRVSIENDYPLSRVTWNATSEVDQM